MNRNWSRAIAQLEKKFAINITDLKIRFSAINMDDSSASNNLTTHTLTLPWCKCEIIGGQ